MGENETVPGGHAGEELTSRAGPSEPLVPKVRTADGGAAGG
ncbi:MAG: hypothetical protein ACJ736_36610 [Streptomyces sp.]